LSTLDVPNVVDNRWSAGYTRTVTRKNRTLIRYATSACFALAALWYAGALLTEGWSHRPNMQWLRRYAQVTWKSYRDYEFGFRMDHLSHWEVARPPAISWTKRLGDGLRSEDVVVIRYHDPFTFVAVVRYRPEQAGKTVDWQKQVYGKGFLAAGFGDRLQQRATLQRRGRTAYEIVGLGPVRGKTYRFASLFIPDGKVGWRVTAGVEASEYPRVSRTIGRMLDSFELESESKPVSAANANRQ
jgi:hypothetical protein